MSSVYTSSRYSSTFYFQGLAPLLIIPKTAWIYFSKIYAKQASGIVKVVIKNPKLDSIWFEEQKILLKNTKVTAIKVFEFIEGGGIKVYYIKGGPQ